MVGRRRCFGSGRGGRSGGVGGSLVLPGLLSVSSDMVKGLSNQINPTGN